MPARTIVLVYQSASKWVRVCGECNRRHREGTLKLPPRDRVQGPEQKRRQRFASQADIARLADHWAER